MSMELISKHFLKDLTVFGSLSGVLGLLKDIVDNHTFSRFFFFFSNTYSAFNINRWIRNCNVRIWINVHTYAISLKKNKLCTWWHWNGLMTRKCRIKNEIFKFWHTARDRILTPQTKILVNFLIWVRNCEFLDKTVLLQLI